MNKEKIAFTDTQFYPIVFMLAVTVVFVGVLSVFYRSTEKGIEAYRKQVYQLQILSVFADTLSNITGIDKASFINPEKIESNYPKYIKEMELPIVIDKAIAKKYYAASTVSDNIIGYCFDVTGSGLWGTMRGLLAVTPDFKTIINFSIYDHMETPGLGARVEEPWFKNQFAHKPLSSGNMVTQFALVPEEAQANTTQIKQITGASITSSSVLKILATASRELNQLFETQAQ